MTAFMCASVTLSRFAAEVISPASRGRPMSFRFASPLLPIEIDHLNFARLESSRAGNHVHHRIGCLMTVLHWLDRLFSEPVRPQIGAAALYGENLQQKGSAVLPADTMWKPFAIPPSGRTIPRLPR
jgi:hypothetical protein